MFPAPVTASPSGAPSPNRRGTAVIIQQLSGIDFTPITASAALQFYSARVPARSETTSNVILYFSKPLAPTPAPGVAATEGSMRLRIEDFSVGMSDHSERAKIHHIETDGNSVILSLGVKLFAQSLVEVNYTRPLDDKHAQIQVHSLKRGHSPTT